jgi:hypothetical protein
MLFLISLSEIKTFHKLRFQKKISKSVILWKETPCSPVELTDVTEDRTASIFSVEE